MKFYTSYWAQVRNFPTNLIGLNTTIWPPKWRPLGQDKRGIWVIDCPPLKPGRECENLCRGNCAPKHPKNCAFLQTYNNQLTSIDFSSFITKLQNLHDKICNNEQLTSVDFAFIVFEAPSNPCSERVAIQNWFRANNIEISEWKKE